MTAFVLQDHILLLLYNIINILLFFINSLKMVHPQISILCWYFFEYFMFFNWTETWIEINLTEYVKVANLSCKLFTRFLFYINFIV